MNSRQNKLRIPDEEETRKWQKIPFRIVQVSSQDEEYSVRELLSHTPFSRGWLSSRFCDYPQQLLIEFPKPIKMREIQFLSHQYSIATKIEIFILPPQSEKFKKIGYLSLDSNERSNFQARELKTVYTDYLCVRVKFNLQQCHKNSHNIYNQVGLIAVSVLGEYPDLANLGFDKNINFENLDKLEDEMIYDPATLKRLKELYKAKKKAVELEDFDEAKRIKVAIDSLKSVSQSLIQLEERKKIAIKNDDFDAAKLIKYEIERLRSAVAGSNINETNRKIMQDQYNNNTYTNNNPLQLPPGYPNTGDKTRMFNTQNQKDYQPINNEYEMENDEDIYRIRNNINQGYQLEDPEKINRAMEMENTLNMQREKLKNQAKEQKIGKSDPFNQGSKGVIDVDNQKVGGIGLNFTEMVEQQLRKEGIDGNNEGEDMVDEQLNAEAYKVAEPLVPVLTFPLIKLLFASQWKNKEIGFNQLNKEIKDYPNSKLFGSKSPEEIVVAVLGACAYVLKSNISKDLLTAMDTVNNLFNKFSSIKPEGTLKSDFDKYVHDCIRLLIDHIGDPNIKLKERIENTLLEFANYSIIGNTILFEQIISGQVKKNLINSKNHLSGRYNFLCRLIQNFGYNENEVPLEAIMTYAIKGYTNPQIILKNIITFKLIIITILKKETIFMRKKIII